jgi:elongation factor Ts
MVEVNCETDFVARAEAFRTFAHELALQIAATSPQYISEKDIPADVLTHEAEIAKARVLEEGKPEAVAAKIVEGRIKKFKEEVCLLSQAYIRDESATIEQLLHQNVASIGENIVIRRFQRWELGEGLGE